MLRAEKVVVQEELQKHGIDGQDDSRGHDDAAGAGRGGDPMRR